MDNVLKFMMMLIALAFLMFLKNTAFAANSGEIKMNSNISPKRKIAV